METGISVHSLSKTYRGGRVRALDKVDLGVRQGEVLGVIGPNGAGKTSLMGCMLGLLRPDQGSVLFGEKPPGDLFIKAQLGYVPERLSFERWMTGRAFVAFHHALAKLPAGERPARVARALQRVGLPAESWGRPIQRYSRGMLQRVGLAQALVGSPRYLFLDEPTSGMDPEGVLMFQHLVEELRQEGATVVLNSHQLPHVARLCDRVAFLKAGRVEAVEELRRGELWRGVKVRWLGEAPPARLAGLDMLARKAGCELVEKRAGEALFRVPGDRAAAALIGALVRRGFKVVETMAGEDRLEKLFEGGKP